MKNNAQKVLSIKKRYENIWLGIDNITAVGAGQTKTGRPCIIVSLKNDDPATKEIFPEEIEDVPIEFKVTGCIDTDEY